MYEGSQTPTPAEERVTAVCGMEVRAAATGERREPIAGFDRVRIAVVLKVRGRNRMLVPWRDEQIASSLQCGRVVSTTPVSRQTSFRSWVRSNTRRRRFRLRARACRGRAPSMIPFSRIVQGWIGILRLVA